MVSWLFDFSPLLRHSFRGAQANQYLYFFRLEFLSTSLKGPCCSVETPRKVDEDKKKSFTENYLISRLGFTQQKAHSSTKVITFQTPDKPDSVISFLYNHGFTNTQISLMAQRCPQLIMSDPEKILLPKIEFFKSLGFSKTDVASIVFASPSVLHRSLEKQLIPSIRLLKSLFQSDDALLTALKRRGHRILWVDIQSTLVPNIEYLKRLGVPKSNIMHMLMTNHSTLSPSHHHFREVVDEVTRMGVNPGKKVFLSAIQTILSMSKETWEKKMKVYIHWGFTEEGILEAFRKHPRFMLNSEVKVTDLMSFLVNEMGFKPSIVLEKPALLGLSLKKRIIPRCSVYRILSERNLLPKKVTIKHFLLYPENKFLNRFVAPFEAQVPELLKSLFQSDDEMLAALKCPNNRILWVDLESTPNIEYLKQLGVPESNIMGMLKAQSRTLSQTHDYFRKVVDQVMNMRVNPGKYAFLLAIHTIVSMSKEKWEKKMKVYIHWGFTEEEILEAFRKQPLFIIHSAEKVTESMSYLINEMGFKPSLVFQRPQLLGLSLKKRIIPRCYVYQILSEKNLLPKNVSIRHLLEDPEKKFLNKYVAPFEAQVPELLNLYNKHASCLT